MVNIGKWIDLSGRKFGMLTALYKTSSRGTDGSIVWECRCECGNTAYVTSTNLKSGNTSSCGCYRVKLPKERKKVNQFRLCGEFYIGYTTNTNEEFTFDKDDYGLVSQYAWRSDKYGYIVTDINKRRSIRLHRLLLSEPHGIIDHKNGNTKDNRRCNLRKSNYSTNQMNRGVGSNSLTGLRGVTYRKDRGNYFARISMGGKSYYLGTFETKEEAYEARLKAEDEMFGEFAYNNSRGGDNH